MTRRPTLVTGTAAVFCADLLIVPTGLLTVALLTRRFGPEDYGMFAVTGAMVSWIEWGIGSSLSRLTIQMTSERDDWSGTARTLLRWHAAVGIAASAVLIAAAYPLAHLLGDARLAPYLSLFALDVPLFAIAQGYRHVLVGRGHFWGRAGAGAGRWLSRFLAIALLVELGFSLAGAIVGCLIASIVEVLICRRALRPATWKRSAASVTVPRAALPLVLSTVGLAWYPKIDLVVVKALAEDTQAGLYAAAQNLTVLPGLLAQALSGLLIATLTAEIKEGQVDRARQLATNAMTASLALIPLAGLVAPSASRLADIAFGHAFTGSGVIVSILMFAAVAHVVFAIATGILTASGHALTAAWLTVPFIPLSLLAHLVAIPAYGMVGAACVTATVAILGAAASSALLGKLCQVSVAPSTVVQSLALCGGATWLSTLGPPSGGWLVVKLAAIGVGTVMLFVWVESGGLRQTALARRWMLRTEEPGRL